MEKKKQPTHRNEVFLTCHGLDGRLIEHIDHSYDEYYEGSCEVIDSDEYRAKRGIRRISGVIYDAQGAVQQEFENRYDDHGSYTGGRAIHADGTIMEN